MLGINDHDAFGATPLHTAVSSGCAIGVRQLLRLGADPNIRDAGYSGYTPAILAVVLGDIRAVEELAGDWRTDWRKTDGQGKSAEHHARDSPDPVFAERCLGLFRASRAAEARAAFPPGDGSGRAMVVRTPKVFTKIARAAAMAVGACAYCGEDGHAKRDCPLERNDRPDSARNGTCHACCRPGHFLADCPLAHVLAPEGGFQAPAFAIRAIVCRPDPAPRCRATAIRSVEFCGAARGGAGRAMVVKDPSVFVEIVRVAAIALGACAYCGEGGHTKRGCPLHEAERPRSARGGTCHACGLAGHFHADCPLNPSRASRARGPAGR